MAASSRNGARAGSTKSSVSTSTLMQSVSVTRRSCKMAQSPPKHFYSSRQLKETCGGATLGQGGGSLGNVTTVKYGGTPVILPSPAQEYHALMDQTHHSSADIV